MNKETSAAITLVATPILMLLAAFNVLPFVNVITAPLIANVIGAVGGGVWGLIMLALHKDNKIAAAVAATTNEGLPAIMPTTVPGVKK